MILISRLLMLIIVIVLLVFCMSNLEPITVNMVGWESPQMPLFLVLLFVFFFGFFLALFWQALRSVTIKKKPGSAPGKMPEQKPPAAEKTGKWGFRKKRKKGAASGTGHPPENAKQTGQVALKQDSDRPDRDEPTDVPAIEDKD